MGFIAGLIVGTAITACIAESKIRDLKLVIANLEYRLRRITGQ